MAVTNEGELRGRAILAGALIAVAFFFLVGGIVGTMVREHAYSHRQVATYREEAVILSLRDQAPQNAEAGEPAVNWFARHTFFAVVHGASGTQTIRIPARAYFRTGIGHFIMTEVTKYADGHVARAWAGPASGDL